MEDMMFRNSQMVLILMMGLMILAACASAPASNEVPNPASVFCEQNGGKLELRQDAAGATAGICVFPDGSECDEWAFYRSECKPGDSLAETLLPASTEATQSSATDETEIANDGWKVYRNTQLGYLFHYPLDARVITNDEPLKSISIIPELAGAQEFDISISHPSDREEYRPPEGTDLPKWLADHYLTGETRLPDVQIAGTTAVHFRHDRSPQSYAMDRYFFANKGQLYMIIIGHTSDIEDWDMYNHFLDNFQFTVQN
jgi:putative hemolysin